jgi:methionyl-tRNA formyltransferase
MDQKHITEINLIFFGTPPFAVTILDSLHQAEDMRVKAVVTQPDRPCGRGRHCKPTPVKIFAEDKGYFVLQPEQLRSTDVHDALRSFQADVFVIAAYGLILPKVVLNMPRHGCLNVHASLLPKYRGASPIQAALLNGDRVTGITIMRMVEALDAGPILLQRAMGIGIADTAQTLHDQLALLGGRLIVDALRGLHSHSLPCIEQDHALATYAPKLTSDQGQIDWSRSAADVHNHIRAMHPWPGAFFSFTSPNRHSIRISVHPGSVGDPLQPGVIPGTVLGMRSGKLAIACNDNEYLISRLHPAHGNAMNAQAFYCGYLQHLDPGNQSCPSKT